MRCANLCKGRPSSFLAVVLLFLLPTVAWSSTLPPSHLIQEGGFVVEGSSPPLQHRQDILFTPASTLKIFTCLAAIEKLGKNFRFETHFFLDDKNNLYVKGFGDPFLTSETLAAICARLKKLNLLRVNTLYLDDSSFNLKDESTPLPGNSSNPYDAPSGALAVNFNALPVKVDQNGTISSGEPQTPLLPLMGEAAIGLPSGFHRLNIATLGQSSTISPALRYVGELFSTLLQKEKINLINGFSAKTVPATLSPIYIHKSEQTLLETTRACLLYSNNFIANQLFLRLGMQTYGGPATWKKSRDFMGHYAINSLMLSPQSFTIKDGSGLSRENKITASALITALNKFKPYAHLLNKRGSILLKSGTLEGVYCYAGYFKNSTRIDAFVILLNQHLNNRELLLNALFALHKKQLHLL